MRAYVHDAVYRAPLSRRRTSIAMIASTLILWGMVAIAAWRYAG